MNITSIGSFASTLFRSGTSSTSGTGVLTALFSSLSSETATTTPAAALSAYKVAVRNADKLQAAFAKTPEVKRELEQFSRALDKAADLDTLLDNPSARKVLLTANGLGDQVESVGLAKKALGSDPTDTNSVAYKLKDMNSSWLYAAETYGFHEQGLTYLKATKADVMEAYVKAKWQESLEAKTPGIASAMAFKDKAAQYDTPLKVLGSALAREVVLTAAGIPKQLAYQSIISQEQVVARRVDASKFADEKFVDQFITRYLIAKNSSASGVVV